MKNDVFESFLSGVGAGAFFLAVLFIAAILLGGVLSLIHYLMV